MKNTHNNTLHMKLLALSLATVMGACTVSLKKAGNSLSTGILGPVNEQADSLGARLAGSAAQAARDTLLSPATHRYLDSLLEALGNQLGLQAAGLRDTLVGEATRAHLARIEADLFSQVDTLRRELLGEDTRARLGDLYGDLGDSLVIIVGRMREELVGARSRAALDSLLGGAIATAARGLEKDVLPQLRREQGFLKRNVTIILAFMGVGIALLLLLAFWLYRRYGRFRRTVEVMTVQIEGVEDPGQRERLKRRIALKAAEARVEPDLRAVLSEQGLLKHGPDGQHHP